ncbi:MAG: hypothetical protein WCJ14_14350 [Verrucomicrobiota bacterium]
MSTLPPLPLSDLSFLDRREVWAALAVAHRHLAELKGLCESLPNRPFDHSTEWCRIPAKTKTEIRLLKLLIELIFH